MGLHMSACARPWAPVGGIWFSDVRLILTDLRSYEILAARRHTGIRGCRLLRHSLEHPEPAIARRDYLLSSPLACSGDRQSPDVVTGSLATCGRDR